MSISPAASAPIAPAYYRLANPAQAAWRLPAKLHDVLQQRAAPGLCSAAAVPASLGQAMLQQALVASRSSTCQVLAVPGTVAFLGTQAPLLAAGLGVVLTAVFGSTGEIPAAAGTAATSAPRAAWQHLVHHGLLGSLERGLAALGARGMQAHPALGHAGYAGALAVRLGLQMVRLPIALIGCTLLLAQGAWLGLLGAGYGAALWAVSAPGDRVQPAGSGGIYRPLELAPPAAQGPAAAPADGAPDAGGVDAGAVPPATQAPHQDAGDAPDDTEIPETAPSAAGPMPTPLVEDDADADSDALADAPSGEDARAEDREEGLPKAA